MIVLYCLRTKTESITFLKQKGSAKPSVRRFKPFYSSQYSFTFRRQKRRTGDFWGISDDIFSSMSVQNKLEDAEY